MGFNWLCMNEYPMNEVSACPDLIDDDAWGMRADSPTTPIPPATPDLKLERRAIRNGATLVAGVDEVGRGPLAGPVVVSAVVLNHRKVPAGLNDSKQLTAEEREALYEKIMGSAVAVSVAVAPPSIIEKLNILWASMWAMRQAVLNLPVKVDYVLVDGNTRPKDMLWPTELVIGGDARSVSIAAASIVAKVTRDGIMAQYAREWPGYGWETNQGYPTPAHQRALRELGPTPIHRRSFAPVRQLNLGL